MNGNPSEITKSKDPARQRTLYGAKMKYIDGMWIFSVVWILSFSSAILQEKWGVTTADTGIRKQKNAPIIFLIVDIHTSDVLLFFGLLFTLH